MNGIEPAASPQLAGMFYGTFPIYMIQGAKRTVLRRQRGPLSLIPLPSYLLTCAKLTFSLGR